MEIKLKGRDLPRNEKGDVCFEQIEHVRQVFHESEIVELVNRALYQLEYQRESHRKRGQAERDRHKALKEALKAAGKDVKVEEVNKQLKGE